MLIYCAEHADTVAGPSFPSCCRVKGADPTRPESQTRSGGELQPGYRWERRVYQSLTETGE